ncbi:BlaI/MecI/CopY family transcriptional regulator [Intrasporangium sp. DVR]|uniref:BlaI/MecI/CopY family transcriptional regulator n=1 Tax=Intrasporangium sp. DVR TaxID=3127867 RepID=UPI00313A4FE4
MASNPRTRLGELERAVMEHLWAATEAAPAGLTVRDVHDAIGVERGLAYTTLMTVLDRMAKKKLVTRERDGRAWRYLPASSRDDLTSEALHHTLGELAGSDRRSALLRFLDQSSPEELDELRAALADLEQREGKRKTG